MKPWPTLAALTALAPFPAAQAADAPVRAALFENVVRCQSVADAAARLRCYDEAVRTLDTAQKKRDIVVVDRAQVRETRRTLFGLSLPRLAIFAGDKDRTDEISALDGVLSGAEVGADGAWTVHLTDGATWRQIDDNVIARRPRAGDKVVIRRAALGSFKMSVTGQPGVRVRRQN